MKALLAAIIAASLSVGCSVLEGEQVSSDTGGGGTTSPVPLEIIAMDKLFTWTAIVVLNHQQGVPSVSMPCGGAT